MEFWYVRFFLFSCWSHEFEKVRVVGNEALFSNVVFANNSNFGDGCLAVVTGAILSFSASSLKGNFALSSPIVKAIENSHIEFLNCELWSNVAFQSLAPVTIVESSIRILDSDAYNNTGQEG
jgi:hypothetical protein